MIHLSALIHPDATIAADVVVGPFTIVEAGVVIGAGVRIGSHCHLGVVTALTGDRPLTIGAGALIRSHSIFYAGSTYGDGLSTGHRVTAREGISAGARLQLGTNCDLQGNATFGTDVRLHSQVQINHGTRVGDFVWFFPGVTTLNDPRPPSEGLEGVVIEDFAAVAARALLLPGIRIGRGALVGAGALVNRDVPDAMIAVGHPARVMGHTDSIRLRASGRPAYPWRRHFHRGYPPEIVARWQAEFPEG